MNVPEAIEIKKRCLHDNQPYASPEFEEADRLGIEAMKRLESTRRGAIIDWHTLLPGETKD